MSADSVSEKSMSAENDPVDRIGGDTLHDDMANAIRFLAMDAIQQANSGHPGMPMGMADVATVLFRNHMIFDPTDPDWANRDRFILSAGHGSMLLYALLYLTGYAQPTLEDIKHFRQLGRPTAGHPEYGHCTGVETTTGPLGQGLATAIGMAMGEAMTRARLAGDGADIIDHFTYVLAGDGCLMEGVSQEAISLAGHLGLSKLIVLWDDNNISIDGDTDLTTSENMVARFEAAGWHVQRVDGHDPDVIDAAIAEAKSSALPSMIACRTTIGYGAPTKAGTSATHGAPLGEEEIAGTREALGWPHAAFDIPADVLDAWRAVGAAGAEKRQAWQSSFDALPSEIRQDFARRRAGDLTARFDAAMADHIAGLIDNPVKVATRKASQMALDVINSTIPETVGGSADLTGSNLTKTTDMAPVTAEDFSGRYVYYGIREFGMAAAMNGLALYGQHVPYGGTFLVFADYARPAIRLAALMGLRVIYVMTHDSIGLGEDGPTHQPIEHLASLRAMPNLTVYRPADAVETAECWALALKDTKGPSLLSLTRQGVAQQRLTAASENLSARGGYILKDASQTPEVVLIASGSEVEIAASAQARLEADGIATRLVSMVSAERFEAQDADWKNHVLPHGVLTAAIEAASSFGWARYVGRDGVIVGLDDFGASAPAGDLYAHFGITADKLVSAVKARLVE